jgi:Zn-dependent peptidase ImmA (M78 family)
VFDDIPKEEIFAVIDRTVADLLAAAVITGPPVDAIALAQKHLGMVVGLDKRQEQRGRAQRSGGRPQIYLRPEPTEERHQWTVAHEIGEHQKALLLERLGIAPERTGVMAGESLANLFAHRLLVPTAWFAAEAPGLDYHLLQLKERYRTASHELIAWRILDLPAPCIITVIDNDRVYKRRSNAWPVNKRLTAAEDLCRRWINEHGKPKVVRKGDRTVQGWPVHQTTWKREILRTVIDADG